MLLFVLLQCPFSCRILLNGFVSVVHCVRGDAADRWQAKQHTVGGT